MKIIKLDKNQIIQIYNERMVYDFPKDELRPLKLIVKPYEKGIYTGFGLIDDNSDEKDILGYAFFIKMENNYLFDYFAISSDKRNTGLGSIFLDLLKQEFKNAGSVIGEVEDPECAENEENKTNMSRRLKFYLSNGYIDTSVRVKLFGVDYIILEMDLGKSHDKNTIKDLYLSHYRNMLPKLLFKKMVCVK
ncbi:MAG: GNAT family N-acetyltransferase [Lachnospiraceae bacterium]|nr:GNAT family N-acetyltransferase [Lachnospiraceae bacterium]